MSWENNKAHDQYVNNTEYFNDVALISSELIT